MIITDQKSVVLISKTFNKFCLQTSFQTMIWSLPAILISETFNKSCLPIWKASISNNDMIFAAFISETFNKVCLQTSYQTMIAIKQWLLSNNDCYQTMIAILISISYAHKQWSELCCIYCISETWRYIATSGTVTATCWSCTTGCRTSPCHTWSSPSVTARKGWSAETSRPQMIRWTSSRFIIFRLQKEILANLEQ